MAINFGIDLKELYKEKNNDNRPYAITSAHKDKKAVSRRQPGQYLFSLLVPNSASQRLPSLAEPKAIDLFILVISFP